MSGIGSRVGLAALAVAASLFDARGYATLERPQVKEPAHYGTPGGSAGANVILVVSDGLRWQEVFRGADSALLFQRRIFRRDPSAEVQRRFWRPTLAQRRQALMPFVWGTLAREGLLLGNRDIGSRMRVTNGLNFSYPGYNELLTGYPDPRIDRNSYGPNPNVTVFEWLNRERDFQGRVAAVGAWEAFEDIFNRRRSGIAMHASRKEPLDVRSQEAAIRFLANQRPRALFIAYVETDDAAHSGNYGDLLQAAHAVDSHVAALWSAVQADPGYRDRTTLIIATDHGRGRTSRDWTDHGKTVKGADETWLAMIGPEVPALGEVGRADLFANAQVAATVAAAVGFDLQAANRRAAPSISVLSLREQKLLRNAPVH